MSVVLYKYLNCAVNKTTNTGHTTNISYALIPSIMMILVISSWSKPDHTTNISYALIPSIMMILVISSWSKPLKTEPCYLI